jgi:hypothetical protein
MTRQIVENSTTGIYHALMPGASPLASHQKESDIWNKTTPQNKEYQNKVLKEHGW